MATKKPGGIGPHTFLVLKTLVRFGPCTMEELERCVFRVYPYFKQILQWRLRKNPLARRVVVLLQRGYIVAIQERDDLGRLVCKYRATPLGLHRTRVR